ncbi:MAG: hypothetical protein U1E29_15890 [Coriobacteriia bacterium]|nr:hypothetical protein [Coriobacteriia bacterium]
MATVHCKDCLDYPAWHRQPGSSMCISAASNRSLKSRPCEPRLRARARLDAANRLERRVPPTKSTPVTSGQTPLLGRIIAWVLLIFGVLLAVMKLLPSLL